MTARDGSAANALPVLNIRAAMKSYIDASDYLARNELPPVIDLERGDPELGYVVESGKFGDPDERPLVVIASEHGCVHPWCNVLEGKLTRDGGTPSFGILAALRALRRLSCLNTRDPIDDHWRLADAFLKEKVSAETANDDFARRMLGSSFHREIKRLAAQILPVMLDTLPESSYSADDGLEALPEQSGMLMFDAVLCDRFEQMGARGRWHAHECRKKARKRWKEAKAASDAAPAWRLWADFEDVSDARDVCGGPAHRSHFERLLLDALWYDEVFPEWDKRRRFQPALTATVHHQVVDLCFRPGRVVSVVGDECKVVGRKNQVLAGLAPVATIDESMIKVLQERLDALSTLCGHRLIRFVINTVTKQRLDLETYPDFRQIIVEGAVDGLVEAIGETSDKARPILRQILVAGEMLRIPWPCGEQKVGGLWMYQLLKSGGPGRRGSLEMIVNSPLLPGYVQDLKRKARISDVLVPLTPLPPFVSTPPTRGPQAAFQLRINQAIVKGRKQLPSMGGVLLTEADLEREAHLCGLTRNTMRLAIDRWTRDGHDGEMVFERVEKDRYHLANNETFGPARRFIDETAQLSEARSAMGKLSADRRRQGPFRPK